MYIEIYRWKAVEQPGNYERTDPITFRGGNIYRDRSESRLVTLQRRWSGDRIQEIDVHFKQATMSRFEPSGGKIGDCVPYERAGGCWFLFAIHDSHWRSDALRFRRPMKLKCNIYWWRGRYRFVVFSSVEELGNVKDVAFFRDLHWHSKVLERFFTFNIRWFHSSVALVFCNTLQIF